MRIIHQHNMALKYAFQMFLKATAFISFCSSSAYAQATCVVGGNPSACNIAVGVNLVGSVDINGDGFTVNNFGMVSGRIRTNDNNSRISNLGTIGGNVRTLGDNSGVINSGNIGNTVRTDGVNSAIVNYGMIDRNAITNGDNSDIVNSGIINNNVRSSGNSSIVNNSGFIANNITTEGSDNTVINSGRVSGNIRMRGDDSTLTLLGGSVVEGAINLSGGGVRTLNIGAGLNADLTFSNAPTNVNGSAYIMPAANRLIAVDISGFATSDVFMSNLTAAIFNTIARERPIAFSEKLTVATKGKRTLKRGWATTFGGVGTVGDNDAVAEIDNRYLGLIAGIDFDTIGIFGGFASGSSDVQHGASETDIDSTFVGVNWGHNFGAYGVDLSFVLGTADHEQKRRVNNNGVPGGIELASADYDGWFISPSATVSVPLSQLAPAIVSLRVNYTGLFLDDYSETGVANPLTIANRDVHLLGTRAQMAFPNIRSNDDGSHTLFELRGGLEGQFSLGSNNVTGMVVNNPLSFDANIENRILGFTGVSFVHTFADGFSSFSASTEAKVSANGGAQLAAALNFNMKF